MVCMLACNRQDTGPALAGSQASSRPAVGSPSPPALTSPVPPRVGAAPPAGEPPTNELQPQPQSVRMADAPPAPVAVPDQQARAERELAARERRLAQRQAALEARERQLRRGERSRAAAGEADAAAAPGAGEAGAIGAATGAGGPAMDRGGSPGAGDSPEGVDRSAGGAAPLAPREDERPRPASLPLTVPAGTTFDVELTRGLASNTSSPGDTFRARILGDVRLDGAVAIPAGAEILGVVTEAEGARRIGGHAKLSLELTDLVLPSGSTVPVHASFLEEGRSRTGRDAATIGGSAAGGALLGRILGHGGRGSILGALVGAAVGTAIASTSAGEEVVIPEGSVLKLRLDQPLEVKARR